MITKETLKEEVERNRSSLMIYVNGKFLRANEPAVSAFDHGLLYGDGVYEAIRKYDKTIFLLQEHVERLYESAKTLRINIPISKIEMSEVIRQTVDKNNLSDAYIRVIVTRGCGKMGIDPRNCIEPTILVMAEPRKPIFGETSTGIKAKIVSIRRIPRWSIDPKAKTLNYVNQVLAKIEAIESGFDEAIMLNSEGFVSEASTENIFIARRGEIFTPPLSAGILDGITRRVVIDVAKDLEICVNEIDVTPHDVYNADEAFVTGTAAEMVPVVNVDGLTVGDGRPGPMFRKVRKGFLNRAYGRQKP